MPDRQEEFIADLLELMASRVYRSRQQQRVVGSQGVRIIGEIIDDTGIGNDNETDNLIIQNECILDCGHPASSRLGGRCHFCDALVCSACISICTSCGLACCPVDRVIANFDGNRRPYCRSCAGEICRSLRLKRVGMTILSFFISPEPHKR
jgi:hypothetical protein